jgi:hypothetical protein
MYARRGSGMQALKREVDSVKLETPETSPAVWVCSAVRATSSEIYGSHTDLLKEFRRVNIERYVHSEARLLHLLKEFRREQTRELPNRGLCSIYPTRCLGSLGSVIKEKGARSGDTGRGRGGGSGRKGKEKEREEGEREAGVGEVEIEVGIGLRTSGSGIEVGRGRTWGMDFGRWTSDSGFDVGGSDFEEVVPWHSSIFIR